MHIVLLGDSVFDNRSYVNPGEPDVTEQVDRLLVPGERVTQLAMDGHVTIDVVRQLDRLPDDATHLFVSVGGNDALGEVDLFQETVRSAGDALLRVRDRAENFDGRYCRTLDALSERSLPLIISTIYYPRFDRRELARVAGLCEADAGGRNLQRMAMAVLPVFNDVILREASRRRLHVLDLRVLCDNDADFANPIEPSATGGGKIARAIVAHSRGSDPDARWARLIADSDPR